jgi:hypothetical protein
MGKKAITIIWSIPPPFSIGDEKASIFKYFGRAMRKDDHHK